MAGSHATADLAREVTREEPEGQDFKARVHTVRSLSRKAAQDPLCHAVLLCRRVPPPPSPPHPPAGAMKLFIGFSLVFCLERILSR